MFNFGKADRMMRVIEFQARLLEVTLASPLPAREDGARKIFAASRDILDACFLFSLQPGDDGSFELHIWWHAVPAVSDRDRAVQQIKGLIAEIPGIVPGPRVSVVHTNAGGGGNSSDLARTSFEVRSRVFSDKLQAAGMVGIALNKNHRRHREDRIAVESILTALVNNAKSVNAVKNYTREIERFATRDPLTNLYNQISFWDLLNYETKRSKRQGYKFSLLAIDLDNFKAANDSYGHDVGDRILKDFSTILKNAVRAGDIAARYAGDQFIAILPVCDEGQAYIVARRIIENLREYSLTLPGGGVVKQTVSIGLAVFPDHAQEAKDLYVLADSMVAQAKAFGKDRLSMPSEHDDIKILRSMGDKSILILEALSKRKIVPYFQPIMNVKDLKIEAYEVLTRIVLNDRVIPAAEFIETAESMGAIGKIDYQLIEQAFAKVNENRYDGNLFLNLSPRAIVLNEFMPTIRRLLRDYGIEPDKMVFEITERDTVKGLDIIERHIRDLKREGFRFAIDDFGAGYSSFQYLRKFSVDFLKVDGDFVRNMNGTGSTEKEIVSSIAALSGKLGIRTIAEFVESEDILSEVASAGIDYAQGYYIKKPSPDLV